VLWARPGPTYNTRDGRQGARVIAIGDVVHGRTAPRFSCGVRMTTTDERAADLPGPATYQTQVGDDDDRQPMISIRAPMIIRTMMMIMMHTLHHLHTMCLWHAACLAAPSVPCHPVALSGLRLGLRRRTVAGRT
jgi:hypothetical protein